MQSENFGEFVEYSISKTDSRPKYQRFLSKIALPTTFMTFPFSAINPQNFEILA